MKDDEFEQFVLRYGKDILRFCRMTAQDTENGDELYQETMLKLLEKKRGLDSMQNIKSYAISTSIYLWKNKKKKYANRMRLAPTDSIEEMAEEGCPEVSADSTVSPEQIVLQKKEAEMIREIVAALPEDYRLPICLYYAADMQISEIAKVLRLPENTVKTRMKTAKRRLKEKLEAMGYDR